MQAGALLAPAVAFVQKSRGLAQLVIHPSRIALPLYVCQSVLQVDGARSSVQPKPSPVPQLEGEDVWSRGNLQHYIIFAGTMHCTCGNGEVIVPVRGDAVRPAFRLQWRASGIR